ncbi:MAG: MotA/TolQ/ExbB proton channel family protein [Pseudomonadota bacterium]
MNDTPIADTGVTDLGAENLTEATTLARSNDWLTETTITIQSGGPVVMILLVMSVIALTLVIAKLFQFQRAKLWQRKIPRQALNCWQQGDAEAALALSDSSRNPTARALARAIRGHRRQVPEAVVREEVLRYGTDALFHLRLGLRPLEVIGSLAPLLGLLGTVMGMIEAFQQLEAAGNKVNPAILSGGIWEALLTTAVGLCVAIPVVALLNWLERSVDHLAHEMDNVVTQVFTEDLSAEAQQDSASLPTAGAIADTPAQPEINPSPTSDHAVTI